MNSFDLKSSKRQLSFILALFAILPSAPVSVMALPPVDIEITDPGTVEVSWPDTGETVALEVSDDLQFWQNIAGAPALMNGRYSHLFDLNRQSEFFRLTQVEVDPKAPVFGNPPQSNQALFPGETISFTLMATDPEGLPIRYLAEPFPLPAGASLNMKTGEFSWSPSLAQTGRTSIAFLAFNGMTSARLPVTFTVKVPPADGETSLSGILLDTTDAVNGSEQPIVGVIVSLLGTDATAITGPDGRFTLTAIPGGLQVLDLATAGAQPAPDGSGYAGFREAISIIQGLPNNVQRPFYLPRLAMESLTKVDPNFTTLVVNEELGTSLRVPPHTAMMDGEEFTGELSISEVPESLAPAALPDNLGFGQLVTIQPVGVRFAQPVPITFRNVDQLPPGSETDIWSLDPDAGVFAVVGKGKVTEDGEFIETIEGGVIAADWHAPLPPGIPGEGGPGAPGPASPPSSSGSGPSGGGPGSGGGGGGDGDGSGDGGPPSGEGGPDGGTGDGDGDGGGGPPGCPGDSNSGASGDFGSRVLLANGAVLTSVHTPAYRSGGINRSVGLAYHSITASPRIIAPVQATVFSRSAVPRSVSLEGRMGGVSGGTPIHFDTSGLSESQDETFIAGLSYDARGLPTGFAPYTIRATAHFGRSSVGVDRTDRAVVVNRSASAYGAGWGVLGDQRVVSVDEDEGTKLLVSGDGSYQLFRDAATFAPFTLASLGGARVTDYSFTEGSFFSQARAAITETFPNAVFRGSETLAQASDADLLVLSPYASGTEGAPLTAADQAALLAFVRGGGCAIVFLDHDLDRSSFVSARASILEPFGLSGMNTNDSGGTVPVGNHPLQSGAFGETDRIDLPFGGFEIDVTGSLVETIVRGSASNKARLALLPEGALGVESGPVIFVADTQAFTSVANIGFNSQPAHRSLLLNALDFCLRSQRDPTADVEFVGSPGDFSRLFKLPNGRFERSMPDGTRYDFNAAGFLTNTESRNGNTVTFDRDGAGNLTRIIDHFKLETRFSYIDGRLSQITDPAGRITRYYHNAAGDLVSVEMPDGATVGYEYDGDHLMTAEIDPEGGRTERVYDSLGRASTSSLPDGVQRQVHSLQAQAADLQGAAGTETDPAPVKRPEEVIASYTNGAGETHLVDIAALGTASRITDESGREHLIERNPDGKPTRVVHPSGREFTMTHDRLGRRTSLTDSATGTTLAMDFAGTSNAPLALHNGQGQSAQFAYDAQERPAMFTSFAGRTTSFTYEGASLLPKTRTNPSGLVTTFTYDPSGNLSRKSAGDAITSFTHTPTGNLASLTDAEGRSFSFLYDQVGNQTRTTLPGGISFGYAYDQNGRMTQVESPSGAKHDFTYDGRGHLKTFVSPLGNALRLSYDYSDGRASRVRWGDGSEIGYSYDDGRLVGLSTAEGSTILGYSATTGLLTQFRAPGNDQLDYTYDTHGRLVNSEWSGIVTGKVTRSYDVLDRINSIAINDNSPLTISYDADELITGTGPMTLTRDPSSGNITSTTLGKCTDQWTYNSFDELTGYTANFNGSPIYGLTLTRDRLGRVVRKDETVQGITTRIDFTYGDSGRLVQELRGGRAVSYTYDANGNRLSRTDSGGATEVGTYNAADQVITYAGLNYTYDACGRLLGRGADAFRYNVLGALQSAIVGGLSLTYQHPAGGRRVSESIGVSVRRQFLYADDLTIAASLDAGGALTVFGHATLQGAPDFFQRNGRTFRIFKDNLGSPRLIIDCESGTVAQAMRHDAFGRVFEDSAPGFQPFGFAGGIYDTTTGFLRFGARDYDPQTGRWTALDPSLFNGSHYNLYTYASNDPVNFIDRNGLEETPAAGSGSCGGGGSGSLTTKCLADGGEVFGGKQASEALDSVGARAMTMDSSIFLNNDSAQDSALYAHEKVHQDSGGDGRACPAGVSDAEEEAARAVENLVLSR